jgi:hypothetical protein
MLHKSCLQYVCKCCTKAVCNKSANAAQRAVCTMSAHTAQKLSALCLQMLHKSCLQYVCKCCTKAVCSSGCIAHYNNARENARDLHNRLITTE